MSQLPTTAIVADEVTSRRVALVCLFEEVIMNFKQKLMACTALLGVWLLLPATAGAQSASDAQKIEKLERQTELLQKQSELLQRQLKEVQEELARTRRKTEKVEAKVEAAPARYSAPSPASALVTKGRHRRHRRKG
jgi:septal ring factor EnvC (AmiA/AmiB activator)